MVMVAGKKPPASTPYLAQRWDGALLPTIRCSTRYWLDPFASAKSNLLMKIHGPSERELAEKTAVEHVTYGHNNGSMDTLRQSPSTQEEGVSTRHYHR